MMLKPQPAAPYQVCDTVTFDTQLDAVARRRTPKRDDQL
jgi:hypothetical protein